MKMQLSAGENIRRFVLIVDDEYVNREILGAMLDDEYNVLYAVNGREAIEIAHENKSMLSCILLDLMMPEMDGFEVMEELQADEELSLIPVIVLTSEQGAEVKSLRSGASDFLTKPYGDPEVIKARVNRTIELSETRQFISAAERDELTGLYTKTFFYEYAEMIDRYHQELKTDAVILNIEHFHLVNEIHGRPVGDRVLVAIAEGIRGFLSDYEGLACRYEADTFFIYLAHQEDYEKLVTIIEDKIHGVSTGLHVRLRIGVYPRVEHDIDMEERFSCARYACNTLRGNYSRSVAMYDITLRERSIFMEHLVNGISEAIDQNQFLIYFQPKYDVSGANPFITSAEALVRWQHPQYGMVRPGTFLNMFEENGLISMLDQYVHRETIRQIARWRKRGISIPISVNVSRVDLYDEKIGDRICDMLEAEGLTTDDLYLEITESAYANDSKQLIEAIERLREDGFTIEMDDFGSGYSSLHSLTTMPVDTIKLDMQFIKNIHEDKKAFRMVKLVMEMAQYLEIPVIAEGVEISGQYDLLREAGCDVIQGYYFSKPLPVEEFEELYFSETEDEL